MKIIFTGDNHIYYMAKDIQASLIKNLMKDILNEKPDIVCNLGDIGEVLMYDDISLVQELLDSRIPTVFILGNHDLYNKQELDPVHAMNEVLDTRIRCGMPLQTHWQDSTNIYEDGDCLFIGTIGFPDFNDPKLIFPKQYYDVRFPTSDGTYINLKKGWLAYTDMMLKAFTKKLMLINHSKCKNVIILTHYPCFKSQYHLNVNDEISPYFYCHDLGQMIIHSAELNPDKKFFCVAGHGHNYNVGKWFDMTNNIKTLGFVTEYGREDYNVLEI